MTFTSSIKTSSLSVSARSWECSVMTCKALVIRFSVSSSLPEDSRSIALRRGKQKEKAGADSGATSEEKQKQVYYYIPEVWTHSNNIKNFYYQENTI